MLAPIRRRVHLSLTVACLSLSLVGSAGAQDPSAADIRDALMPPPQAMDRTIIVEPKGARAPGKQTAKPAAQNSAPSKPEAPSISLKVQFEFNSAEIAPEATRVLQNLATALRDPSLAGFHFEIAGHTDGRGDADYNLGLSERRAEAVRSFLVKVHGIAADRLEAHGYGKTRLVDPGHPDNGVNRRVEIVNLGAKAATK